MANPHGKKGRKSVKAIDKWKLKKTFEVIAPDIFNNVSVGPIVANEAKNLVGRVVETTLSKLVNSNQYHIKIKLTVEDVSGFQAMTKVKEVELSRAYINSQVSEGIDIIDFILSVVTNNKQKFRIKLAIFTRRKIHDAQKRQLRKLALKIANDEAAKDSANHLIQEVVFGKLGSLIFNKGKKIVPLGRVEVRKLELVA